MLNTDKVPGDILAALKLRGLEDAEIQKLTPKEAFSEFCRWNGLSDWGNSLWLVVEALQAAEAR